MSSTARTVQDAVADMENKLGAATSSVHTQFKLGDQVHVPDGRVGEVVGISLYSIGPMYRVKYVRDNGTAYSTWVHPDKVSDAPFPTESPYKVGDIVRLKSGGPGMTVSHVGEDTVVTTWFDEEEAHHSCTFGFGVLVHVKDQLVPAFAAHDGEDSPNTLGYTFRPFSLAELAWHARNPGIFS